MARQRRIIIMSGHIGAGKDYAATVIKERGLLDSPLRLAYANVLKQIVRDLLFLFFGFKLSLDDLDHYKTVGTSLGGILLVNFDRARIIVVLYMLAVIIDAIFNKAHPLLWPILCVASGTLLVINSFISARVGRFTIRRLLQVVGADILRHNLGPNIFVDALIRRIHTHQTDVIITDARFTNEISAIVEAFPSDKVIVFYINAPHIVRQDNHITETGIDWKQLQVPVVHLQNFYNDLFDQDIEQTITGLD